MIIRVSAAAALAAAICLVAAPASHACSQCLCGSLTPAGYTLLPYQSAWLFGVEDLYVSKSAALEAEHEEGRLLDEVEGRESQREHRMAAFAGWRPKAGLFLRARVPVVMKSLRETIGGEESPSVKSSGLGDVELLTRLDVIHFTRQMQKAGGAGLIGTISLPTGSSNATTEDGERFDEHLQPGIGAVAGSLGFAMDRPAGRGALSFSAFVRVSGTNSHEYQYGSAFLANLGYARPLNSSMHVTLELNGRYADGDAEDGERVENTGGSVLYVSPGLQWAPPAPVSVNFFVQLPVARSLRGVQTENPGAKLALSWSPH